MNFRRAFLATVLATATIFSTAACNMISPVASMKIYAPSDGAQGDLGPVKARNLLILSNDLTGQGKFGFMGVFANESNAAQTFVISWRGENGAEGARTYDIPAYQVLYIGQNGQRLLGMPLKQKPGSTVTVTLSNENDVPVIINVPVFDKCLPGYTAQLAELGATTTPQTCSRDLGQ